MKNELENIDQLFQQELGGHQVVPPNSVWTAVKASGALAKTGTIAATKGIFATYGVWIAGAAVALSAVTFAIVSKSNQTDKNGSRTKNQVEIGKIQNENEDISSNGSLSNDESKNTSRNEKFVNKHKNREEINFIVPPTTAESSETETGTVDIPSEYEHEAIIGKSSNKINYEKIPQEPAEQKILSTSGEQAIEKPHQESNENSELNAVPKAPEFTDVITPDGDGINDYYFVKFDENSIPEEFVMVIFDEKGMQIFKTNDSREKSGWTGKVGSQNAKSGNYIARISYKFKGQKMESKSVRFTLIRK